MKIIEDYICFDWKNLKKNHQKKKKNFFKNKLIGKKIYEEEKNIDGENKK
jgi:hypothetical protein